MDHDIGFCDHLYTDTVLIGPFPAVWKRDGNLDRPLFRREAVVHAGKQTVHVRNFRKKTGNFLSTASRRIFLPLKVSDIEGNDKDRAQKSHKPVYNQSPFWPVTGRKFGRIERLEHGCVLARRVYGGDNPEEDKR